MQAEVFFAFVFLFVVAIVVVSLNNRFRVRELEHKEKLAAIEKGAELPVVQSAAPWTPRTYLLHGMIWLFAGLASMAAIIGIAATSIRPVPMENRLFAVTDARSRGATPEEIEMLLKAPHMEERIPIGLGLLGLIPVGIGMAYLVFYRVESKKLVS
jgi:hypothetical protein